MFQTKKTISLAIIMSLLMGCFLFTGASYSTNNNYISFDDAKLIAVNFMKERVTQDKECPWCNGVQISDIQAFYDLDDLPNAYVFNLKTDNKETGFIFVEANKNAPDVQEFGYRDKFAISKALISYNKVSSKSSDDYLQNKTYYLGGLTFVLKGKKANNFYDLFNKSTLNEKEEDLKSNYKKNLLSQCDTSSVNKLNNIKKNNKIKEMSSKSIISSNELVSIPITTTATIYSKNDVIGLTNMTLFATYDFTSPTQACVPCAATTLIAYWVNQRGKTQLYHSSWTWVYQSLYQCMNTDSTGGTEPYDIVPGFLHYGSYVRGLPATHSEYLNVPPGGFSDAESMINSSRPFLIFLDGDNYYKYHEVVGLGYEYNSNGQYLRIADGWSENNYQTWYKYPGVIASFAYASWD